VPAQRPDVKPDRRVAGLLEAGCATGGREHAAAHEGRRGEAGAAREKAPRIRVEGHDRLPAPGAPSGALEPIRWADGLTGCGSAPAPTPAPTASVAFAPITRTTVADEIVKRLVDLILEGRLKPGDKLPSERELMDRLAVGRSSLREAIKTLRAIGVVDVAA